MRHMPYPESEHKARLILGDPVANTYAWIDAYAKNLDERVQAQDEDSGYADMQPITTDLLIDIGKENIDNRNGWGTYLVRGGVFEGNYVDPTYWDKLSILLGKEIPQNKRDNFFSCSC